MDEYVTVTRPEDGIVVLTLNRPEALNAIHADLSDQLASALDVIAVDTSVRAVILTGAGRGFCAGLDLNGFGDDERIAAEGPVGRMMSRQRELADLVKRLHELPQPVIAAVNGPAAGAGLALVCGSDIRVAAEPAIFAVSFITAGYSACDLGVSWLLPRIMGAGVAHELMLTGRRFDSTEALAGGLLTRVVPSDTLMDCALDTARLIRGNAPLSVEMTKQGMWASLEIPSFAGSVELENRQQVFTALTDDRAEATAAFLGKRPAVFHRR